jgi:hypothetical protein
VLKQPVKVSVKFLEFDLLVGVFKVLKVEDRDKVASICIINVLFQIQNVLLSSDCYAHVVFFVCTLGAEYKFDWIGLLVGCVNSDFNGSARQALVD